MRCTDERVGQNKNSDHRHYEEKKGWQEVCVIYGHHKWKCDCQHNRHIRYTQTDWGRALLCIPQCQRQHYAERSICQRHKRFGSILKFVSLFYCCSFFNFATFTGITNENVIVNISDTSEYIHKQIDTGRSYVFHNVSVNTTPNAKTTFLIHSITHGERNLPTEKWQPNTTSDLTSGLLNVQEFKMHFYIYATSNLPML